MTTRRVASAAALCLAAVAAQALKPTEAVPLDQWADRYRIIPEGTSEDAGRWDTASVPYLREPMQALSDPDITEWVMIKGSQVGGTECLINFALWAVDSEPGPMIAVYPSTTLAQAVSQERLIPSVRACPRVTARLRGEASGKGSPRDLTALQLRFDRMSITLVGSNSQTNLESRAARYLMIDEVDSAEMSDRAIELALQRLKAYVRRKACFVGKPGMAGRGIDALYQASDRRHYQVPCPRCDRYQELIWRQVRWSGGMKARPEVVEREAWYECVHCRGKILSHEKPAMLARGRWIRDGQSINADGETVGEGRVSQRAGFRVSSLYAPKLGFGYVARRYIEAGGATRDWVTGELGEPWQPPGDRADANQIKGACTPASLGGYKLCVPGTDRPRVPAPVVVLIGGIDVQHDRVYWEVRGFSERGTDSYLVAHGSKPCPIERAGALRVLDPLVTARLIHAHDGLPINVAAWGIDSGDGRRTLDIYEWAKGHPNVYATKGRDGTNGAMGQAFTLRMHTYAREGQAPEQVRHLGINTDYYKGAILTRIQQRIAEREKDQTRVPVSEQAGRMYFAEDTGADYLDQITSEQLTTIVAKRGRKAGRPVLAWTLRPGRRDNHHLDTCVITLALADALGVRTVTNEQFAASRPLIRQQVARESDQRQGVPVVDAPTSTRPSSSAPSSPGFVGEMFGDEGWSVS